MEQEQFNPLMNRISELENENVRLVALVNSAKLWAKDNLTVRDQFAMASLPVAAKCVGLLTGSDMASLAYELADEMLKARALERKSDAIR